jgi:hypothetical protein
MGNVDVFRFRVMRHISQMKSVDASWAAWKPLIEAHLGPNPTSKEIYSLGDKLGNVFRSKVVTGRTNKAVSTGGYAWEGLVCWYLNLLFHGTNVVVVKPIKQFLPKIISDALAVTISNIQTNTESDLVAFNVPNFQNVLDHDLDSIQAEISANPQSTEVSVIQCKTNWNDNAQIPMLWDLIYSSNSFRVPNVSVGSNGVTLTSFKNFRYSFVTVPTSTGAFNQTSQCVLRVRNLSGGNYWGRPTSSGVSKSISEFCASNFGSYFNGTVQNSLQKHLVNDKAAIAAFVNLKF